jgi:SpoU rRNA methylase family enzyme
MGVSIELKYIALYAPTSVQRVIDFIKTVYVFNKYIPVIIKPIGAAAQIGVPEAYKYAYRMGKPLIVLPEINDIIEVLNAEKTYYISLSGREVSITDIMGEEDSAIIINGGEQEPSKKELLNIDIIKPSEIPCNLPPVSLASIILYILSKHTM